MIDPLPPELFVEPPVRSDFARRAPSYAVRRIITVAVVLSIIVGGIYFGVREMEQQGPGEIPVIKAEGTFKQRPEQPGGIDIPHQDVQVYQALDSSRDSSKVPPVERLLPPPEVPQASAPAPTIEKPLAASQMESLVPESAKVEAPAASDPTPQSKPVASTASPHAMAQAVVPEPIPAPVVAPQPTVSEFPVAVEVPAPARELEKPAVDKTPAKVAPETKAEKSAEKSVDKPVAKKVVKAKEPKPSMDKVLEGVAVSAKAPLVQLASVQDEVVANIEMKKLQSKYADVLGTAKLRLVRADLGEKGIYYRIQSQPLGADKASAICSELKKVSAGCIIVRP